MSANAATSKFSGIFRHVPELVSPASRSFPFSELAAFSQSSILSHVRASFSTNSEPIDKLAEMNVISTSG